MPGVNPVEGLYEPLPDTLAVPTVVPPDEQSVGAVAWGPNTLNVTVPPGADPPESAADTSDAEIAVPAVPDDGAVNANDVDAGATIVASIDAPHAEADPPLL